MTEISTQQERKLRGNPNPSPDTRFGAARANPQSPGGWRPENTISYQYKRFMNMTPAQMASWAKDTDDKDKTVAMVLAYERVSAARRSLQDVKEITDRTEGKASQAIDITSNGESINPYSQLSVEELRKLAGN